jgi:nitrite reductase/ring-hydroxylating ferredoxin subunit
VPVRHATHENARRGTLGRNIARRWERAISSGWRGPGAIFRLRARTMEPIQEIFAICSVDAIADRRCKPFTLLRVDHDGRTVPWQILILRWGRAFYGYVNRCPHQGTPLNFEANQFFDPTRNFLMCGKHGAQFDIKSGACMEGACQGQGLAPLQLITVDGDICVSGVRLVEEGGMLDIDPDDTMDIMIHPD